MWLTRLLKPICHVRDLLLCYTSKKVTSKLHKLTNYKSNYTRTMYMKVNKSLCNEEYKLMGRTILTRWFLSRGSRVCQHASPYCVNRSLGGSVANWHHPSSPHVGHRKNIPKSEGSLMTRTTRVPLRGSRGASTTPLTITSPEHRAIFLACFDGDHHQAIRRW